MKKLAPLAAAAAFVFVPGVAAQPPGHSSSNSSIEFVEGFVCPVIFTENVLNSPKGISISEGHYSIAGPHPPSVPRHATNTDGAGDPMGEHAAPGDPGYTAIWEVC